MARKSFQLFLHQIASSPEVLRTRVLQIVFDILMVHEGEFLGKRDENVRAVNCILEEADYLLQAENILKFLLNVLSHEKAPKVQALLCIGFAKLILSGMISDEKVGFSSIQ
jgi:condensin complex subunit 3